MSASDCLKKLYVRLNYVPPKAVGEPADCKVVTWARFPEITIQEGGIEIPCHTISTSGAGSIVLILQVPGTISWEFGYMNKEGKYVTEWHMIQFSIPYMLKISFIKIALMRLSPWKLKALVYSAEIANLIWKLHEMEKILGFVAEFGLSRCETGRYQFLKSLNEYAKYLNDVLQGAVSVQKTDDNMAELHRRPHGTGRFAGATFA